MTDDETWTLPRIPLPDVAGGPRVPARDPAVPLGFSEFMEEFGLDLLPGSPLSLLGDLTAEQRREAMQSIQRYLEPLRNRGALFDMTDFTFSVGGVALPVEHITLSSRRVMGMDFSALETRAMAFDMEMSLPDAERRLGAMYGMGPMRTACYGTPARDGTMELSFDLTGFDGEGIASAFGFHWPTAAERAAQRVEAELRAQIAEVEPTPSTGILGALRSREITENICTWVQKPIDVSELPGHNNNTGAAFHPPGARNSTNDHHRNPDHRLRRLPGHRHGRH